MTDEPVILNGYHELKTGQTFRSGESDGLFNDYLWTVVESCPDEKPGVWRLVAERPWEFGTHTMTTFWPAPEAVSGGQETGR